MNTERADAQLVAGAGASRRAVRAIAATSIAVTLAISYVGVVASAALPQTLPKSQQSWLFGGSSGPADLQRGEAAAMAGRDDEALRNLQPLARRGYVEAQLALGVIGTRSAVPDWAAAEYWYRQAAAQDPRGIVPLARVLMRKGGMADLQEAQRCLQAALREADPAVAIPALAGLIDLYAQYPLLDRSDEAATLLARSEHLETPEVLAARLNWYRSRADDAAAQSRFLDLCERWRAQVPRCYADLALAARKFAPPRLPGLVHEALAAYVPEAPLFVPAAVAPGVGADDLVGLVNALVADPGDARAAVPTLADEVLHRLFASSASARIGAANLVLQYPYLAPEIDIEQVLAPLAAQGLPEAQLYLGRLYTIGRRARRQPELARQYLRLARSHAATRMQAEFFLGRLYQIGYLDETDPQQALQHLLTAARMGSAQADGALARLFMNGGGVVVDLENAYVFTRLALHAGMPLAVQEYAQTRILHGRHQYVPAHRLILLAPGADAADGDSAASPAAEAQSEGEGEGEGDDAVAPPDEASAEADSDPADTAVPPAVAAGTSLAAVRAATPSLPPPPPPRTLDAQRWLEAQLSPADLQRAQALYARELALRPPQRRYVQWLTAGGGQLWSASR